MQRPPTPDRDYEGGPFVRRISNNVGAPLIQSGFKAPEPSRGEISDDEQITMITDASGAAILDDDGKPIIQNKLSQRRSKRGQPIESMTKVINKLHTKTATQLFTDTSEAPAQPIRMPAYAQLVVSSTDRYPSFSAQYTGTPIPSSDWILQRNIYLLQGYFSRIGISQIQVQMNLPTICQTTSSMNGNDIFGLSIEYKIATTAQNINAANAGTVTLTVAAGLNFTNGMNLYIAQLNDPSPSTLSFHGIVSSYSSTTLVINGITGVIGTFPATKAWNVSYLFTASVTLIPGFRNPTQLAANLQTSINIGVAASPYGIGNFMAVSINSAPYGRFIFAAPPDYTFIFLPPTAENSTTSTIQNAAYGTIGINSTNIRNFSQVQISGPPTMCFTRWIDICSSSLTKFQRVKDATTLPSNSHMMTLARVYMTPPNQSQNSTFGAGPLNGLPYNLTVDFGTVKWCKWSREEVISNFDIQVRDEYGQLLYWNPGEGIEFEFTLLASET